MPHSHVSNPHLPTLLPTKAQLEGKVKGKYLKFGIQVLVLSDLFVDEFQAAFQAQANPLASNAWLVTLLSGPDGYGFPSALSAAIAPAVIQDLIAHSQGARDWMRQNFYAVFPLYVGPDCTKQQLKATIKMLEAAEVAALAAKLDEYQY